MSKFSKFMKQNKKLRENVKVAVTESLVDEDGQPLLWELRPLTSSEVQRFNTECTTEKTLPNGQVRRSVNGSKLTDKLIIASVVSPDLNDAELQDSYGVMEPADLLHAMVDDPGEYNALSLYISNYNHLNKTLADKIDEAKN